MKKSIFKFSLLLLALGAIGLLYYVPYTYAKYRKNLSGDMDLKVARWDIRVNNESVMNKLTLTNDITPHFISNDNVAEGFIAPGSEGYFDLTIDPGNTEVSFTYNVSIEPKNDSLVSDIKMVGYVEKDPAKSDLELYDAKTRKNYLAGTMLVGDIPKSIRVYFEWYDSEGESMDNAEDTEVGGSFQEGTINLTQVTAKIRFTQLITDDTEDTPDPSDPIEDVTP